MILLYISGAAFWLGVLDLWREAAYGPTRPE